MARLVECVPNFSEGRRAQVVEAIAAEAREVRGITFLGLEMDADHNRSVLTFVGPPEAAAEAAFRAVRKAAELIDLRRHTGAHPRMGAADVVPFVPLGETTMEDCVALARGLGERIAAELRIPVYLYGEAARTPERRDLAVIRKGEFEKIRETIAKDRSRIPDYGARAVHPGAGATAVGARFFLVAYNVNLRSRDLALAKAIAKRVREKDGGLPAVKAMGFDLPEKGLVQVSMNLTDFRRTGIGTAFEAVRAAAAEKGVEVAESEVVGLVPRGALRQVAEQALRLTAPLEGRVIEDLVPEPVDPYRAAAPFLDALAADTPTPGGGSAAALAGAMGAALVAMVARLTLGREKYAAVETEMRGVLARAEALRPALESQVRADSASFEAFMAASRMPKKTPEEKATRAAALEETAQAAAGAPLETARLCCEVLAEANAVAEKGNRNAASDGAVAALLAHAGLRGAVLNIRINMPSVKDEAWKVRVLAECDYLEKEGTFLEAAAVRASGLQAPR